MCGIAGLFDPRGATTAGTLGAAADAMADAVAHRGPDGGGCWVDGSAGVALAHRRLAVVGLGPTGSQPMVSPGARWVVTYNGELYNAPVLRRQLADGGVRFEGGSDTEVLAAGFDRWGLPGMLDRVEGMFALAAWDTRERHLHLVRDRFGEKPLYYGWVGPWFVFGSELKAVRACPGFRGDVDADVVAAYLRRNCVPAPACIYRGLAQLRPGSRLSVGAGCPVGVPVEPVVWWSAVDAATRARAEPLVGPDEDLVEAAASSLSAAVGARMTADVAVGALLSGGIDSTLVVALMGLHSSRPVRTFTVAFADRATDESADAARVATHLGTDHTTVPVTEADALAQIPRLPEVWDEPFGDSSQLPTLLVAQVARRHVTVALSGDGGDELFAGYNRHAWLERLWGRAAPLPVGARRRLGDLAVLAPPALVDAAAEILPRRWRVRSPATKLAKAGMVLSAGQPAEAYERLTSHWPDPLRVVPGARAEACGGQDGWPVTGNGLGPTEQMLLTDLVRYLPDDVCTKVDRATMAASLEARMPFLDRCVLDTAWRLPPSARLRGGTTKWVLRQVLDRHVPRSLVDRPKAGFGPPVASWLRGPLRPWAEDLLHERALRHHGLLDPAVVRDAWARHLSGRADLGHELWDVLMLQAWADRWGARR